MMYRGSEYKITNIIFKHSYGEKIINIKGDFVSDSLVYPIDLKIPEIWEGLTLQAIRHIEFIIFSMQYHLEDL
jgi:hypothetical protein